MSSILENKDMIETAELNVKTSELEPVEIIDLFSKVNIKGIMKEIENERYIYIGKRNR